MALSKTEILDGIAQLSVMDIVELIEKMEKKFNVTAALPVAAVAVGGASAPDAVEEQTEFKVMMTNHGANKVSVIKVVRTMTNLGLKEAKDLVEATPALIKEGITKKEAEDFKKQLEEVGASIEIK